MVLIKISYVEWNEVDKQNKTFYYLDKRHFLHDYCKQKNNENIGENNEKELIKGLSEILLDYRLLSGSRL